MITTRKPPNEDGHRSPAEPRPIRSADRRTKAEKVLEHYATGASLRRACKREGISAPTFCRWTLQDPWLAEQYELARLIASDLRASDIEDCAASALKVAMQSDPKRAIAAVAAIGLKVATMKWLIGRWAPKRYGGRVNLTAAGPAPTTGPVAIVVVPAACNRTKRIASRQHQRLDKSG